MNGVPLRRVNQTYVIATSTKVDTSAVNVDHINDEYFARVVPEKKEGEDEFFAAEAGAAVTVSAQRKEDQKTVDSAIVSTLDDMMTAYLKAKFTLKKGMYPHLMKF